jgi:hypothetical protein
MAMNADEMGRRATLGICRGNAVLQQRIVNFDTVPFSGRCLIMTTRCYGGLPIFIDPAMPNDAWRRGQKAA